MRPMTVAKTMATKHGSAAPSAARPENASTATTIASSTAHATIRRSSVVGTRWRTFTVRSSNTGYATMPTKKMQPAARPADPVKTPSRLLVDFTNHAARIARRCDICRNIARHHGTCTDNSAIPDAHARQYDDAAAQPAAIADRNWPGIRPAEIFEASPITVGKPA